MGKALQVKPDVPRKKVSKRKDQLPALEFLPYLAINSPSLKMSLAKIALLDLGAEASASGLRLTHFQAAATASRHVVIAAAGSFLAGAAVIAFLVSASAARACSGSDEPSGRWTLDHREYSGESGLPFLSPGNDSRINLQFLMMDESMGAFREASRNRDGRESDVRTCTRSRGADGSLLWRASRRTPRNPKTASG